MNLSQICWLLWSLGTRFLVTPPMLIRFMAFPLEFALQIEGKYSKDEITGHEFRPQLYRIPLSL